MARKIIQMPFGEAEGTAVIETVMQNKNGMRVASCTYGATITEISVPDRSGTIENIVCSFKQVEDYRKYPQFFGSTIGPFAGRLENSEIIIDGKKIRITPNEENHLLHGGKDGFHQALWTVETFEKPDCLVTNYTLTSSTEFPGTIQMEVSISLFETNEVVIEYNGTSSENTLLNCTNHSYFNLSGNLRNTIHQHTLQIPSRFVIPLTEQGLPGGTPLGVEGTVFNFLNEKRLDTVLGHQDQQIQLAGGGLDHPFLLEQGMVILKDDHSGRRLTIFTEEPAVVVYTGNKIGSGYQFREVPAQNFLGICLEEQNVPNSIRHSHYPSSLLERDSTYSKKARYRFDVIEAE